jgi:hypothetical protein
MDVMARGNYTYSFGNNKVTGSAISNYVNTAIRWEKKKTLDFGLDLGMFNNQLEFTFDWYKSTSEDLALQCSSANQCRCNQRNGNDECCNNGKHRA